MKTWKLFAIALMLTASVTGSAWADEDAVSTPTDASATEDDAGLTAPPDATAADAEDVTATDAADAATAADAAPATDTAGDGTATTGMPDGDHDGDGGKREGGCTASPSASSPIALGLAGALLGWVISRSRQPAKAPVRKK